jgi:hypothetical protein
VSASDERVFVDAFVVPSKRERYASFLASRKQRPKFLRELYHFADFDPACLVAVSGSADSADGLLAELRRRGAPPDCRLISARRDLDGTTRPLEEAVRAVHGVAEGTIVLCVPGELAYYEGEAPNNRFILDRRARRRP